MAFRIEQRGGDFWASPAGGSPFFVGRRVRYAAQIGLCNIVPGAPSPRPAFVARNYAPDIGLWAQVMAPTIACEGGSFTAFNSYDRARFTFGIGQFAAHVPDGPFVGLMRRLLTLAEVQPFFPMLTLRDGRICRTHSTGVMPLESARSTARLMLWMNPRRTAIDGAEVDMAARLIHVTRQYRTARLAQIREMMMAFRRYLRRAAGRLPLDGRPASQCCVLADLMHHGRAGRSLWHHAGAALAARDPLAALLAIGADQWPGRVRQLRRAIMADAALAQIHWQSAHQDFAA